MPNTENTVFISYRRSVSRHLARSIFLDLREHNYDVFLDVNTIDNGEFDNIILNQIAARAHFVLILSKGALERAADSGDWLRREIEEATRLNRNIVPIIEEGFDFEAEKQYLPASLHDLPRRNGIPLYHFYFDAAMDTLRNRFLKQEFNGQIAPTPTQEEPIVEHKIREATHIPDNLPPLNNFDAYMLRAIDHWNRSDFNAAIADYSEAIRLNPYSADAYSRRASARYYVNDFVGCVLDSNIALQFVPNWAFAYNTRGWGYYRMGNYPFAINDFMQSIYLNPNDDSSYLALGYIYDLQGQYPAALEYFQRHADLKGSATPENVRQRIDQLKRMFFS